ncbi:MerR family transcriptional regulator [Arthrobacter pigmenti]
MSPDSTEPTMHIGELAERTGLSLRTIRHYDEVGLLPATSRTEGGFRVYSSKDLERLMVIRRMKPLGFSLEEMSRLLEITDRLAESDDGAERKRLQEQLKTYIDAAQHQREKLAVSLERADEFLQILADKARES